MARYTGGIGNLAATSPEVTGVSKLDTAAPASEAYLDYLSGRQSQFISQMNTALGRSVSVEFQYKNVLNALAVAVSHDEALALAQLPEVAAVYPDSIREFETDVGPQLMGAPTFWEGDYELGEHRGEGVIVGFLDTGINPVHPSFAAVDGDGYEHENPYGEGNYVGVCDDTDPPYDPTFPCNDKLIGAWNFHPDSPSAFDWHDHGSHVGSTIAGNKHEATFTVGTDEFTRTISGVAPRANVISYLVCFPTCPSTSSVAATEQAIDDGVDVLNYSISGGDSPWTDIVDLAFLDAVAAGMYVSASAGNDGPGASTVAKTGPWNASVAASTHNRVIAHTVDVTSPAPPALENMAAVTGEGPAIAADIEGEAIWAETADPGNVTGCDPFPADAFDDEIALIIRGGCTFETKVENADAAGAKAVIVYNNVGGPPIVMGGLEDTDIPAVMIDQADGEALAALTTTDDVEVVINAETSVVVNDDWADIMAGFSSRGPSQWDLLKPDFTAPGVNILAAGWQGEDAYVFMQGTSMSSPHAAGAAALMVQRHEDWTPAEIKSALAMTAWQDMLKEDGVTPTDYFDMGTGRIDLTQGALVGLVMDETVANYQAADPNEGGEPKTLNQPSMVDQDCIESCSWTRTVRSVLAGPADYEVTFDAPVGMDITVVPDAFTIFPGATQELEITVDIDLDVLDAGAWAFAQIELDLAGNATTADGVLLEEGFEDEVFPPAGWTSYDLDGDGEGWRRTEDISNSGDASAYHPDIMGADQDGWLVTPLIDIEPNTFLSFYERGIYMSWYVYSGVWLSTDSCDPADDDFVELIEVDDSTAAWRQMTLDLSAYAGESACLAFVYGGEWAHAWWIDDVQVEVFDAVDMVATHKLPIAVVPFPEAPEITLDMDEIFSSQIPDEIVTETLTIGNTGGIDLEWEVVDEAPDVSQPLLPVTPVTPIITETAQEVTIGDDLLMFSAQAADLQSYTPSMMPMAPGEMTITHSVSQDIQPGNSIACSPDGGVTTTENGYLRTFTLRDFGIFGDFAVTKVSFGLENLTGLGDTLDVNLYTLDAEPFIYDNMTLIGTAQETLDPDSLTIIEVPVTADVPADATLVVEVDWPDTRGESGFFIGSNNLGQTAPSYLRSASCGLPQPTNIANIGFPGMHIVMNVTGEAEPPSCDAPHDVGWIDVSPLDGVVSPFTTQEVDVTFDSTGVAEGVYNANLCMATNDPARSFVVVPLEMEVFEPPVIGVDPEELESSQLVDTQVTLDLDIQNTGLGILDWIIEESPGVDSVTTGVLNNVSLGTIFEEGFDDITLLEGMGWAMTNNSDPLGVIDWFQGNPDVFPSHSGDPDSYIGANFNNTAGVGTISNWLMTPEITMENGHVLSFYTRRTGSAWEDRLQVRMSTSGDSTDVGTAATDVGDFDTLLLDINPTYAPGGYPDVWTQYQVTVSGLTEPTNGRLAFRYFVEDGGPAGTNSDYIGIDTVTYAAGLPCDNLEDVDWLSASPTSGQVLPGEDQTVEVTIDSTGLDVHTTYEAYLCVFSNDLDNPVVPVPVSLEVLNTPPVAYDQDVDTLYETPVEITLEATDAEGHELTYSIVDVPDHGTLVYEAGDLPVLTYIPDEGWDGTDTFTFIANDGWDDSNVATVTILVYEENLPPVAVDDYYETDMDVPLIVEAPGVLENDYDPNLIDTLVADLKEGPQHGTVVLNEDGSFEYIPDQSFFGEDSFTYRLLGLPPWILEGQFVDTATVYITVHPPVKIFMPLFMH